MNIDITQKTKPMTLECGIVVEFSTTGNVRIDGKIITSAEFGEIASVRNNIKEN